jgi:hypothetical protein
MAFSAHAVSTLVYVGPRVAVEAVFEGVPQSVDVCYCCLRIKRITADSRSMTLLISFYLCIVFSGLCIVLSFCARCPESQSHVALHRMCVLLFSVLWSKDDTCFPSLITQVTAHYAPGNALKFCIILRLSFSSVALCTKSHKAEQ